jgi:addiction module HigA family antidote
VRLAAIPKRASSHTFRHSFATHLLEARHDIRTVVAMRMHNPPHPGEIIKALCLEPLGVTVTQAAEALGVSRKTLSAILNGRAGISPEMAVRLSIAFGTSAESWLNQQTQYDLWHAEKRRKQFRVAKLAPA